MSRLFLFFFLLALPLLLSAQQPLYLDDSQPIERRIDDAMSRMTLQEKINILHAQSKFSSHGIPRLGFPDFWTDDGPHGVRPDVLWDEWEQAGQTNDSCVAFPALTCLAATWNPSLAWHYGHDLGEEARYRGKDMILGPGVNILRTPLGGRNFEYMGEDPWLTSTLVVPYIRGLQSNGVAACVKHFALNNDEENRHQVNVKVSDRALHEIYLPAFHAAVTNGGAWALMGAYNLYRDEHNCHNEYLIKDLLKRKWGFDGVVVSDWGGCHDTDQAVNNGLDMEFGTWTDGLHKGASNAYDNYFLANAYRDGLLSGKYSMQTLDDKVRRVLRLFFRTTMARRGHGFLCSEGHYQTARRIADEGIVLLQNKNHVLPLDLSRYPKVLVVGENAIKMMTVGGGSSSLKAQREISPLDGLQARLRDVATVEYERGYVGDTTGAYNGVTTGQDLTESRSQKQLVADAVAKARTADYVIIVGGLNKSDYQDCEGHDRKEYGLPYGQDELVEALTKVNRRVIFVNISGNPVAMPWHDRVAAIVQGWYGGSVSGEALADVLSGDVCPSGKLPLTWPQRLEDVGAHALKTYPGTWRDGHKIIDEEYREGIYVGYRWAEAKHIRPLFAFGHGLGYTTFKLSDLRLSSSTLTAADSLTVTVNVRNTGHRAGAETVQLYIHDDKCSVDRPVKELKGFAKVSLQPGESKDVSIVIGRDALSFYDEKQGSWKAEPGTFTALVGNASDNIVLKKSFVLK